MFHQLSLEDFVRTKMTENIENPLEFKEIPCEVEEWVNIPSLIT
jgi:hypothetical protein